MLELSNVIFAMFLYFASFSLVGFITPTTKIMDSNFYDAITCLLHFIALCIIFWVWSK